MIKARTILILQALFFSCAFLLFLTSITFAQTAQNQNPAAVPAASMKAAAVKTPTEKGHTPIIRAPELAVEGELFFVTVQVGENPHEMTEEHRVEWIDGFLDGKPLFHLTLSSSFTEPRLTIPLRLKHPVALKIEAHCSVHGTWGSETLIRTQSSE